MKHTYTDQVHSKELADQLKNRTQLKGYDNSNHIPPVPNPPPNIIIQVPGLFHNTIMLIKKIYKSTCSQYKRYT